MTNDKDLGDHLKDMVDVYCQFLLMQEYIDSQKEINVEVTAPKHYDYTKKPRPLPRMSPECEQAVEHMRAMEAYKSGVTLQNAKERLWNRHDAEEPEP